jgi:type IV pilus assembly protein PilM
MTTLTHAFETAVRLFPPPRVVTLPAVGIDISDRSVKYIALDRKRFSFSVVAYGTHAIPEGVVVAGEIQDSEQLSAILKKVRQITGREFAFLSLPEEHAYLFHTEVPGGATQEEIYTAIEFNLKENVPLPPSEATFAWSMLSSGCGENGMCRVSVAVYPERSVQAYGSVLFNAGLLPRAFEIEGEASARAVVSPQGTETVMVLDMGRGKAGLSIVQGGVLMFTSTLTVGGDDLTHAIQKEIVLSFDEAESIKRENGLLRGSSNEKIYAALLPSLAVFREEIERHYVYWQWHGGSQDKNEEPSGTIDRILLCGGDANLIGLPEYLEGVLGIPVERADVWKNVPLSKGSVAPIPAREALSYATAIGLASRDI